MMRGGGLNVDKVKKAAIVGSLFLMYLDCKFLSDLYLV